MPNENASRTIIAAKHRHAKSYQLTALLICQHLPKWAGRLDLSQLCCARPRLVACLGTRITLEQLDSMI